MKIKVCGMKYPDNIKKLSEEDIDFIGFIFYHGSKRYVKKINADIPSHIKKIGVFVRSGIEEVQKVAETNELDYVQLHGDEGFDYCSTLTDKGLKIIKVFRIDEKCNFKETTAFESVANYFLFDTKAKQYGGTGKKFNWAILQNYKGKVPFLLSGGISPDDDKELLKFQHRSFAGIDINSRFETEPALKDISKIKSFIKKIKNDELFQNR